MNPTEIAAWIGATTGSLALLLNFVKWVRSGTRLAISSNSNMVPLDHPTPDFPAEPHLVVWVRNVGDAPTTVTTFGLEYYRNRWLQLIRRGGKQGILLTAGESLPKVLRPGEQWSTVVKRGSPVDEAGRTVCSFVRCTTRMSRKPARHVVRFANAAEVLTNLSPPTT